ALGAFRDGSLPVLVATDIAARGLDIDQLPQVVNYELPNVPEDYVHRIGRTGRAGSPGAAITLVEPEERKLLAGVERLLGRRIPQVEIAGHTGWSGKPETEPEHPGEARARTGQLPPRSAGSPRGGPGRHAAGTAGRRPRRRSRARGPAPARRPRVAASGGPSGPAGYTRGRCSTPTPRIFLEPARPHQGGPPAPARRPGGTGRGAPAPGLR